MQIKTAIKRIVNKLQLDTDIQNFNQQKRFPLGYQRTPVRRRPLVQKSLVLLVMALQLQEEVILVHSFTISRYHVLLSVLHSQRELMHIQILH